MAHDNTRSFHRIPLTAAACAAVSLLAACGGGGGAGSDDRDGGANLTDADIEGYVADATQFPVIALDAVIAGLQAVEKALPSFPAQSYDCQGGGSMSAPTAVGDDFDAGDSIAVTFRGCAPVLGGAPLTGSLTVTVESVGGSTTGFSLNASGFQVQLPGRTLTAGGPLVLLRTVTARSGGQKERLYEFTRPLPLSTSNGLLLSVNSGGRLTDYSLWPRDWSVTKRFAGVEESLQSNQHAGNLVLHASYANNRRPDAQFQLATVTSRALVVGADAYVASGGVEMVDADSNYEIDATWGLNNVEIDFDGGGARSWTATRQTVLGRAG